MKRILPVFLLLLLLLTGCGETTSNASSEDGYQQISQEEAKEMMDTQDVIILDVREQDEYDSGHIPGAVLLPVGTIDEETAAGTGAKLPLPRCLNWATPTSTNLVVSTPGRTRQSRKNIEKRNYIF